MGAAHAHQPDAREVLLHVPPRRARGEGRAGRHRSDDCGRRPSVDGGDAEPGVSAREGARAAARRLPKEQPAGHVAEGGREGGVRAEQEPAARAEHPDRPGGPAVAGGGGRHLVSRVRGRGEARLEGGGATLRAAARRPAAPGSDAAATHQVLPVTATVLVQPAATKAGGLVQGNDPGKGEKAAGLHADGGPHGAADRNPENDRRSGRTSSASRVHGGLDAVAVDVAAAGGLQDHSAEVHECGNPRVRADGSAVATEARHSEHRRPVPKTKLLHPPLPGERNARI
mmetsp:Transcript_13212/g.32250  ORF Transcript_13212/g.32250 Transcript_13212/m.32250 type:complete len:285 (+) Transcript_13212:687-1541(+)